MNTLQLHALSNGEQVAFNSYKAYKDNLMDSRLTVYVNGSRMENIFNSMYELHSRNVFEWFDMLAKYKALTEDQRAAVKWLVHILPNGCSMNRALELAPTVSVFKGYEIDYVRAFVNDEFHMQHKLGHMAKYFDYAGYCFDLQKERKISKVTYENKCYTITNADLFNVWGI